MTKQKTQLQNDTSKTTLPTPRNYTTSNKTRSLPYTTYPYLLNTKQPESKTLLNTN